jgi:peptidoglycan/LPS O-acetylase OafA/YrhL
MCRGTACQCVPRGASDYLMGLLGDIFVTLRVWQSHAPRVVCGSRPFVFVRERSYSAYLLPNVSDVHDAIAMALERASEAPIGSFTFVLCEAIILTTVVALSQVTYVAIERPFMRWRRASGGAKRDKKGQGRAPDLAWSSSSNIDQHQFGLIIGDDHQFTLVGDRGTVSRVDEFAVDGQRAAGRH